MNEEMKNSVLNLVDTCIEAIEYSKNQYVNKHFAQSLNMLIELAEVVKNIQKVLEVNNEKNFYTCTILCCKNIVYSIDKILMAGQEEKMVLRIITMEVRALCYELSGSIKFNLDILPYQYKWEKYRADRKAEVQQYLDYLNQEDYEKKRRKFKYKASIVVTAYNKLEYTKAAIESIYKYTDFERLNVELITVNNGSSDGTEEYFEGLPHTKKINLKYNILGICMGFYSMEGEYSINFSNDVLASEGWLEKLIACMESDKHIFWAVPTCNCDAISNGQGVAVPYKNTLTDIEAIQNFAQTYNREHQKEWEERAVLMPFVSIGRSDTGLSICDNLYTQLEFTDDDASTTLRRAGLKLILVKDAFLHHFGSITLKDAQIHSNSLNNMREVYYKKWGVDAWDSKGDFEQVEALLKAELIGKNPSVLFIEPRFGGNHLRVKNHLQSNGIALKKTVGIVLDSRYIEDARYMYDEVLTIENINEFLANEKRKFNLIYFGTFLNNFVRKDAIYFLENVYDLLEEKGQIIFAFKNYHSARTAIELLTMGVLGEYATTEFSGYNASMLFYQMTEHKLFHGFKIKRIGNYDEYVDNFVAISQTILKCSEKMKNEIRDQLATRHYVVAINKE